MSKYSQEFKLKVIHHYLTGKEGFIQAALSYGLHRDVLRKWVHAYQLHDKAGLSSDRDRYTLAFKLSVLRFKEQHQLLALPLAWITPNGILNSLPSMQGDVLRGGF